MSIRLLLAVSLAIAPSLPVQGVTTGSIAGVISGSDSLPVANAVVRVVSEAIGERWQAVTRADGRYAFEYLSEGGPLLRFLGTKLECQTDTL